jgi:hypothetical protein
MSQANPEGLNQKTQNSSAEMNPSNGNGDGETINGGLQAHGPDPAASSFTLAEESFAPGARIPCVQSALEASTLTAPDTTPRRPARPLTRSIVRHADLLHDESTTVRKAFAEALQETPAALPALASQIARALLVESDERVVFSLYRALKPLAGNREMRELIPALTYLASHDNLRIALGAIECLSNAGLQAETSVSSLYSIYRFNRSPSVRSALSRTLEQIDPDCFRRLSRVQTDLDNSPPEDILQRLKDLSGVRPIADSTLLHITDTIHLSKNLDTVRGGYKLIESLAPVLTLRQVPYVLPSLMLALELDDKHRPYTTVKQIALLALGKLRAGADSVVPLLEKKAERCSASLKPYLALACARIDPSCFTKSLEIMRETVGSHSPRIREVTLNALLHLAGEADGTAAKEIIGITQSSFTSTLPEHRELCAAILGACYKTSARNLKELTMNRLTEFACMDENPDVRAAACKALIQICSASPFGRHDVRRIMSYAAEDPDPLVRTLARKFLEQ